MKYGRAPRQAAQPRAPRAGRKESPMKTTTTTRAAVMNRAHALTRATLAEYPTADYRATFRAALSLAWKDCTARAQWETMSGDEQYNALLRMVWYAKRRDSAACDRLGNERAPHMAWIESTDDARAVAHDAFCRMPRLLDRFDGEKPLPLILYKAVAAAAQYIDRAEKRHANAIRTTETDGGETVEYIIDNAAPTAEHIAPNPEQGAIIADSIDRACADDIDREIVRALAYGLKQREIAAAVGISQQAIAKRIARIRDRYAAA